MTADEIKALAEAEQRSINLYAEEAAQKTHDQLNVELNAVFNAHKPLQDQRVKLAMRMMILQMEIRMRMLKKAFPGIKTEDIKSICQLTPSDQIIGDTETWIQKIKTAQLEPNRLQVDRVKMTITLLE